MWAAIFFLLAIFYLCKLIMAPLTQASRLKKIQRELERQRRGFRP